MLRAVGGGATGEGTVVLGLTGAEGGLLASPEGVLLMGVDAVEGLGWAAAVWRVRRVVEKGQIGGQQDLREVRSRGDRLAPALRADMAGFVDGCMLR